MIKLNQTAQKEAETTCLVFPIDHFKFNDRSKLWEQQFYE